MQGQVDLAVAWKQNRALGPCRIMCALFACKRMVHLWREETTGGMAGEGNEQCATLLQKLQCRDVLVSVHRMGMPLQTCIIRGRACQ